MKKRTVLTIIVTVLATIVVIIEFMLLIATPYEFKLYDREADYDDDDDFDPFYDDLEDL